jgi:HD-GYP domain-containing protein (c-di-GMP phosphodiesterase class II)
MNKERLRLEKIIELGNMMTELNDTDVLMENILTEARRLCNCDAGSIYRCEDGKLVFSYTQNDTQQKLLPPGKKLIYNSFRMDINERSIAGYVALHSEVLNIRNAYQLDPGLSYGFNKEYDKTTGYITQSMLTLPMRTSTGRCVGVLQLINALDYSGEKIPFSAADIPYIKHFANNAAVALERADMTRAIILRMIGMAELRDPTETGAHVNRVGAYAAELYEAWANRHDVPETELQKSKDLLRMAAMLHDVGKVGISDNILKKPDKLTDEEFDVIKTHPIIGAKLFSDPTSELDRISMEIALRHHERWDGRGYPGFIDVPSGKPLPDKVLPNGRPQGLTAEESPLWARIVAVADVYDALSSRRCYKDKWDQSDVYTELEKCAGTQFDPEIVDILLGLKEEFASIRTKYPDPLQETKEA